MMMIRRFLRNRKRSEKRTHFPLARLRE